MLNGISSYADRVVVMCGGKIVEESPVDKVFEKPPTRITQGRKPR